MLEGGDEAYGGRGNDRFELSDLRFALIDGGGEIDTIVLPTGARVFDLGAALATGRIVGIEAFELRGGQEIVVRAADAAALVPGGALRIDASATDKIDLVGSWTAGVTENGYVRYTAGTSAVLVKAGATVAIVATGPAGATGLDAVAGGDPALRPGAATGVDLTPDGLYVSYLEIYEPTIIPTTDIWFTEGKVPALWAERGSASLTVKGNLIATNETQATAIAADLRNGVRVVVEGSVGAESRGAVERPVPDYFPVNLEGAYAIRNALSVTSTGYIGAYSLKGMAVALGEVQVTAASMLPSPGGMIVMPETHYVRSAIPIVDNRGVIEARSDASWAVGVVGAVDFNNGGDISVIGAKGAIGVVASVKIVNSGSIIVASDGPATGIVLQPSDSGYSITNSGYIEADTAILVDPVTSSGIRALTLANSGTIRGDIQSGDGADRVTNAKAIDGAIHLAGGDDVFDGSLGAQGNVYGDDGNDVLTGGAGNDVLVGGRGDDVLDGRGGSDTAVFAGPIGQYAFTFGSDVITVTSVAEGTDRLSNIENFRFGATTYTLAELRAALTAPTPLPAEVLRASPGDGTAGVSPIANLTLAFAGAVTRGTGTITLARADGTVVETFDAATSTRLTIAGNVLTIDPTRPLTPGTGYVVSVGSGALGIGGTSFGGFTGYDFTTAATPTIVDQFLQVGTAGTRMYAWGYGQVVGDGGVQDVSVVNAPGRITLDPSFNLGGDRIRLEGSAADWTARRSGSSIELSDGDTNVVVPVGLKGADLLFADGVRTLVFDTVSASIKLGGQALSATATAVTAPAGTATATGAVDFAIPGQLALIADGKADAIGNSLIVGTTAAETVILRSQGPYVFDPSFNAGGDTIVLPGSASGYSAKVSGSTLVLTAALVVEGPGGPAARVEIPIGVATTTLRFADGDRALHFDAATQRILLGDTAIARSDTRLSDLPTTAATLDRDDDGNLSTAFTIDASGGNFRFTDSAATAQNVRLTGYGAGDRIVLEGSASDYLFSSSGSDLVIHRVGDGGAVSTTTIVGLVDPAWYVNSPSSAALAAGIDFVSFTV